MPKCIRVSGGRTLACPQRFQTVTRAGQLNFPARIIPARLPHVQAAPATLLQ